MLKTDFKDLKRDLCIQEAFARLEETENCALESKQIELKHLL